MTEPSKRVARLLEVARGQHDPTADDRARVYAALQRALPTVPTGARPGAPPQPGAVPPPAVLSFGAGKVLWMASLLAGVAVVGVYFASVGRDAPAVKVADQHASGAAIVEAASAPARTVESRTVQQAKLPAAPQQSADELRRASQRHSRAAAAVRSRSAREAPSEPGPALALRNDGSAAGAAQEAEITASGATPAPAPAPELAKANRPAAQAELSLISAALRALNGGDPALALSLLARHTSEYPRGAFRTERLGLRVLALCASGRTSEGRMAQANYLRDFAETPAAARVAAACKGKP